MIDNCSSSNFAFIFWTISINIDCRKFALLYFGQFLFKYQRVCFSIFLNSDKEITTSGLNKFPWWGIIKRIYISKERLESTTCFYSKSGWFYTFFFVFVIQTLIKWMKDAIIRLLINIWVRFQFPVIFSWYFLCNELLIRMCRHL